MSFISEIEHLILSNPHGCNMTEVCSWNNEYIDDQDIGDIYLYDFWFWKSFLSADDVYELFELANKYKLRLIISDNTFAFRYCEDTRLDLLGFQFNKEQIKLDMINYFEMSKKEYPYGVAQALGDLIAGFPPVLSTNEIKEVVKNYIK